jgi:glycosyltransferase involved in cell wall biosynthesis
MVENASHVYGPVECAGSPTDLFGIGKMSAEISPPGRRDPNRYCFLFASAIFGGNTSVFESMKALMGRMKDFDSHWLLMDEKPREWIALIPPMSCNWTLKGGLSMRARVRALEKKGVRFDAAFFNHLIPAIFLREFRRRVPSFIAMDVTPKLMDMYARWYGVATTSRRSPLELLKYSLASSAYADAKGLAPFSDWAARSLRTDYNISAEKISVIPVGIDLSRWISRGKTNVAERPVRILFVGSDFLRKGGDLVLELARREEFRGCEFHFLSYDAIRPLSPNVFLHANVKPDTDDLRTLYQESDIFVLPSRGDLSPVAILEAMAMELPVISTDVGGISELVTHGQTGFVVPPDDLHCLAASLRALVHDRALRLRFGARARQTIEQHFNLGICASTIVDQLKEAADLVRHRRSHAISIAVALPQSASLPAA